MAAFKPIVAHPAYRQVADRIAEAILAGELPAGEPLPNERDLSRQFGVSRTTIREALRVLQARGLVVSSGSRTRPLLAVGVAEGASGPLREALIHLLRLRRVRLEDLVELRIAVETAAVERAAGGADPDHLREARAALERMRRPGVDVEDFDQQDVRFHLALVGASGNRAMHLVMLAVRDSIAHHLRQALGTLPRPVDALHRLAGEHQAILQAVEAGEGARARRLVRQHILGFYRRFVPPEADLRSESAAGP